MKAPQYPWCGHCGSRNHLTHDCSKPGDYVPTAADMAEFENMRAPAPPTAAEPVAVPKDPNAPCGKEPARWPGGPEICEMTNLPSFPNEHAMKQYQAALMSKVVKEWRCVNCGEWHYLTDSRGPGDQMRSSSVKTPGKGFRRKMRESAFGKREAVHTAHRETVEPEAELPTQPKPMKEKPLPAAPKKVKQGSEMDLFK